MIVNHKIPSRSTTNTHNRKIFMCVNYPAYNPAQGISKKIRTQIETFETLGFKVTYTAYTHNSIVICQGNTVLFEKKYPKWLPKKVQHLLRKFIWLKTTSLYLDNTAIQYDLGFIRWGAVDRSLFLALRSMKKYCNKIIMDCHGYHPNYSVRSLKGRYIMYSTLKNGSKLSQYLDLCLTETKLTQVFGVSAMPIDTGINVDKYRPHVYQGNPKQLHMISVANEQSYHGYARLIEGIHCSNRPNVFLHLVGKMSNTTIKKINKLGLSQRIFLHGYKTGQELEEIYSQCNMGVGPLAPHRGGGKEGTGIKTKEYFAIGLPYFYAGQELLVPDDYPYVLKMSADDSPINIETVIEFYESIKTDNAMQQNMRAFAREHYSWKKIFKQALSILNITLGDKTNECSTK